MKRTGLVALLLTACVTLMAGCASPCNNGGLLSRWRNRRQCCDPCPCALPGCGSGSCEGGLCAGSGSCGEMCCEGPVLGEPVPGLAPAPAPTMVPPITAPPGRLSPEPPGSAQPTPAGPMRRRK
jgi:hypothetical protein